MRRAINVRELLEEWARWRVGSVCSGWPTADSVGRLMAGVPGTGCPTCSGKGRVDGKSIGVNIHFVICPTCGGEGRVTMEDKPARQTTRKCKLCDGRGEYQGKTCFACRGIGEIVQVYYKINPAGIRGTRHLGKDDDPMSQKIDFLICTQLTEAQSAVVILEYGWTGNQNQKISRLKVTHSEYNRTLEESEDILTKLLTL